MSASLFDKYGGFANISKIVMTFYDKVIDSDQIGHFFDDVDMRSLIDHQTKFIAAVMGGPASYTNDALRAVHADFKIGRADFEEMAKLLQQAMTEHSLEAADIDQVMREITARAEYVITRS